MYNATYIHSYAVVCCYYYNLVPVAVLMECLSLAKAQKEHHEKKEKAKLSRTQIDFVSSSAAKRSISAPATGTYVVTIRAER